MVDRYRLESTTASFTAGSELPKHGEKVGDSSSQVVTPCRVRLLSSVQGRKLPLLQKLSPTTRSRLAKIAVEVRPVQSVKDAVFLPNPILHSDVKLSVGR